MKPKNNEDIQRIFDSYSKSVLKRTVIKCYRLIKRLHEREITFSAVPVREMNKLIVEDKYFTSESIFNVLGENVIVSGRELNEALNALPPDKRDIILMSYFFEMTDKEIAEHLNMARRTVTDQRSKSLKKLKKLMEGE